MTGEVIDLPRRPLPAQHDLLARLCQPASVSRLVPNFLASRRGYIESECLRIASGAGKATVGNILSTARFLTESWGATSEETESQIEEIETFVGERLALYAEITGLPCRTPTGHRRRG